jgi:hypothetical protein
LAAIVYCVPYRHHILAIAMLGLADIPVFAFKQGISREPQAYRPDPRAEFRLKTRGQGQYQGS